MSWRDAAWVNTLRPVLALIGLVGGVLFFSSIFFRAPGAPPVASLNPKHWRGSLSESKHWFRPPGFTLYVTGFVLFSVGAIALTIVGWFR